MLYYFVLRLTLQPLLASNICATTGLPSSPRFRRKEGSPRMAESSTTPLLRKLGVKAGQRLAFVHAPDNLAAILGPLPAGTDVVAEWQAETGLDLILFFARSREELDGSLT